MPKRRRNSQVSRSGGVIRRVPAMTSTPALVGAAGLVLIAVVTASTILADYVNTYLGGLLLGVGIVATVWTFTTISQRAKRSLRFPGRSRTRDCRPARWRPPTKPFAEPRPPTDAQRRSVPCPGSRRS